LKFASYGIVGTSFLVENLGLRPMLARGANHPFHPGASQVSPLRRPKKRRWKLHPVGHKKASAFIKNQQQQIQ
jgi:hypothetical protein